jgi:hypothetical protein
MNLKTTYILFGVVFAVLLVVGLLQIYNPKNPTTESDYVFPDLVNKEGNVTPSEIDNVRVERTVKGNKENLLFVRDGANWEIREPAKVRIESYQVEDLVRKLMSVRKETTKTTSNLKEYGLEDPAVVVTLQKGDKTYNLSLGSETATTVVYGLASTDPKKPFAIKKASLDPVFKPFNDFRSKELLAAKPFQTTAVALKNKKEDELALEKVGGARWRFQKPNFGEADYDGETTPPGEPAGLSKKITGVHELLNQIEAIRVETDSDFLASNVSDADLASKYGLEMNKPDLLRIEVKQPKDTPKPGEAPKETITQVLLIGKKAEPDKDDKGKETKADYYYARLENENSVMRVPAKKVEGLIAVVENPSELRDRNLISMDPNTIDAIDIQNSTGSFKLRRPNIVVPWSLYRNSGSGEMTDLAAVQNLVAALTAKRLVNSWPDPKKPEFSDKELQFDHPTAVISLWENAIAPEEKKEEKKDDKNDEKKDEKKEEKKDGDNKDEKKEEKKEEKKDGPPKLKPDVKPTRLTFGKHDRDKHIIYVRRETRDDPATATLLTVPDTLYDRITAGPLAYLDRKLPSWVEAATKVTLTRSGQTFQLEKGETVAWTFKEPKDLAGRRANGLSVQMMIENLRSLQVMRFVAENPPEAELQSQYGLKPPLIDVTVSVPTKEKDKPEEFAFQFGKETEDKQGVFAKMSKSKMVFVVHKSILTNLQADLRDPSLFDFEPASVKKLKVVFWIDAKSEEDTLELERKPGGAWSVLAPAKFMDFDDSKAESFLSMLGHLRAEKIISATDAPKPDQAKFDLKAGALQIEVTLTDKDKPVTLTIGGDVDKKSFYAKSSATGDEVFLVPFSLFDGVKGKPNYFKKAK